MGSVLHKRTVMLGVVVAVVSVIGATSSPVGPGAPGQALSGCRPRPPRSPVAVSRSSGDRRECRPLRRRGKLYRRDVGRNADTLVGRATVTHNLMTGNQFSGSCPASAQLVVTAGAARHDVAREPCDRLDDRPRLSTVSEASTLGRRCRAALRRRTRRRMTPLTSRRELLPTHAAAVDRDRRGSGRGRSRRPPARGWPVPRRGAGGLRWSPADAVSAKVESDVRDRILRQPPSARGPPASGDRHARSTVAVPRNGSPASRPCDASSSAGARYEHALPGDLVHHRHQATSGRIGLGGGKRVQTDRSPMSTAASEREVVRSLTVVG